MSKRQKIKTIHPLEMAESLKAQNEAVGVLLMKISTYSGLTDGASEKMMKQWFCELKKEAEKVQEIFWPQDEDRGS